MEMNNRVGWLWLARLILVPFSNSAHLVKNKKASHIFTLDRNSASNANDFLIFFSFFNNFWTFTTTSPPRTKKKLSPRITTKKYYYKLDYTAASS